MSKRKIFNIIAIGLLVVLFINMFLELADGSGSLWDSLESLTIMKVVLILELVAGIALCALQVCGIVKDSKYAVFPVAYFFTEFFQSFSFLMKNEAMDYAGIGLWVGLIVSIAALVVIIIANLMSDEAPQTFNGYRQGNMNPMYNQNPGMPMYNQPMNQPMNQPGGYNNNGSQYYR